jgi:ribosome-binding protein aMBF1 (putative translation factor)
MSEQEAPATDGQETFVGTAAAQSRIARLRKRPGAVARAGKIQAEMVEADRAYADGLAAIRKAADMTQIALATQMGVAQSEISRLESRHDMLLSTLVSYLTAAGERPRVVVTVNGRDVELDLTGFAA